MKKVDEKIRVIVERVFDDLPVGRCATDFDDACRIMELIVEVGGEDHLEIGVLHGATAIMAALVKKEFGLSGVVVCVDPLTGFYPPNPVNGYKKPFSFAGGPDIVTGKEVCRHNFEKNIAYFGVEEIIVIVPEFSYPWPAILKGQLFSTAYIDGDHYGDAPITDWENVSPSILYGGYVIFDGNTKATPSVCAAVEKASNAPYWHRVTSQEERLCIVQYKNDL